MSHERILVVGDDSVVARDLQETLTRFGYEVPEPVSNADDAFDTARRLMPDLVLVDAALTGKTDGVEAARRIQSQLHIPHVYCTELNGEAFTARVKQTNPLGYVSKPISEKDLKTRLELALHKAHSFRMQCEIERLASALVSLGDAVIVADPTGQVTFLNRAAEELTGWSMSDAKGKLLAEVFPIADETGAAGHGASSRTAELLRKEGWGGASRRILFAPRLGMVRSVEACASPVLDVDGELSGVAIVFRDTTEKRSWEISLEESNERFRLVSLATNDAIWDWDIKSDLVEWNEGPERLFGYAGDEVPNEGAWWTRRIHPEDGDRILGSIHDALQARQAHWSGEYRFRRADGTWATVSDRGYVVYEDDGTPCRMIGCMTDISERKAMEEERLRLFAEERAARAAAEAARLRSNFLSAAGKILISSLDHNATLARVANLAVTEVCDWCAIDLVEKDGALRRVALSHSDPAKSVMAAVLRCDSPDLGATHGVPLVLSTRTPQVWTEFPEAIREHVGSAADAGFEAVARFGAIPDPEMKSCLLVPILGPTAAIGVITLLSTSTERVYTEEDLEMAQDLAVRIALALENARLYEETCAAVRMRDDFVAIAAHEIRSPVTTLQLHLNRTLGLARAETGDSVPPGILERLELMHSVGQRLVETMDQLLDLSRLASSQLPLNDEACDLAAVVRNVIPLLEHEIDRSGCTITTALSAAAVGYWDPFRIQQIVTNLISNALKYGRGKPVRIAVHADETSAWLEVRDQGIGIASRDRERIFEPYARVGPRASISGLGIGLHIARQIADVYGGRLSVESAPDSGSTFTLELPLRRAAIGAGVIAGVDPDSAGRRVLIVDDSEDTRVLLTTILGEAGYEIVEAIDGRDALAKLCSAPLPDLILADVAMPVMDGAAFVKELRKDPVLATVPVVLISGRVDLDETAAKLGVSEYLDKREDASQLLELVKRYCARN
jgi:PAS domain S-box-containing protein